MPVLQHWESVDGEQNTTPIAIVKVLRNELDYVFWHHSLP